MTSDLKRGLPKEESQTQIATRGCVGSRPHSLPTLPRKPPHPRIFTPSWTLLAQDMASQPPNYTSDYTQKSTNQSGLDSKQDPYEHYDSTPEIGDEKLAAGGSNQGLSRNLSSRSTTSTSMNNLGGGPHDTSPYPDRTLSQPTPYNHDLSPEIGDSRDDFVNKSANPARSSRYQDLGAPGSLKCLSKAPADCRAFSQSTRIHMRRMTSRKVFLLPLLPQNLAFLANTSTWRDIPWSSESRTRNEA